MSIAQAISQLSDDRGISQDLICKIVEEFLLAAYENKFSTKENAVVQFNDIDNEPTLFAQKRIVESPEDPVTEIALSEALKLNAESEIDDELLIEINPKEFDWQAIQSAKQHAKESLSNVQKDILFSEFNDKIGKMVVGYIQHEQDEDIYIDLGNIEGVLPKKFQSPREEYRTGDRVKAIIYEVTKLDTRLQVTLSRTHIDFVKRILELEVPEIQDHTIEIHNIVREPGYRTKISVYTNKADIDPVGACVGVRGTRIQTIIKELEGERVDVLTYSSDIHVFITNALSPARIEHVQILDEKNNTALAIVNDDQLSLAIGKHGLNVRLANKIVGWNIDVKTRDHVDKSTLSSEAMESVSKLFKETEEPADERITHVSELLDITPMLVLKLQDSRIEHISDLVALSKEERAKLRGLDPEEIELLEDILHKNKEIIEGESADI